MTTRVALPIVKKDCNLLLALEFVCLCLLLPTVIIVFKLAPFMFFFLWAAALYCGYHLWHGTSLNFAKRTWKWKSVNWQNMKSILPRFFVACLAMLIFTYFYAPERMFSIIYNKPEAIPFLLVLYPVLSALPQELIFCSFLFHRYKPFFHSARSRIIVSALVFAYAHVLYINWVAPTLSFIAGLIFAYTYSKTRSLALVTVEHALYGNALFLIGLGWYFWGGAVH